MSAIKTPMIVELDRLARKYRAVSTRAIEKNNKFGGTANTPTLKKPVKEDWMHNLDIDDYKGK